MTMMMDSPPSKREALRPSRSNRRLRNSAPAPPPEDRVSRRQRLEKSNSTRGLGLSKTASARWQASRTSSRTLNDDNEEEVQDLEASDPKPRRRGTLRRTASMDTDERAKRRPLQRTKSCDGSTMPFQRVQRRTAAHTVVLERSTSVRRFGGRKSVMMDRSKSERRFEAAREDNAVRMPSRRQLLDNSSDDGGRSSRRRPPSRTNSGMLDDSSNTNRRRALSRSMSSSSGGNGGVRRGARKPRTNERRESTRLVTDSSNGSLEPPQQDATTVATPGKGLDDSSRRRKEPTLSKLSINELRNRLVGATEEEADGEDPSEGFHSNPEVNWEIGTDAGPLDSNLNKDDQE